MYETPDELRDLQALLDQSFDASSEHLVSIMEPHRRLDAERIAAEMPSPAVLNIATVTATGQPRVSAVDGHFLHGHWYFGTATESPKVRHLRARPATSASFTPKDGYGVFCHGTAVHLDHDHLGWLYDHLAATYNTSAEDWHDATYFRIDPHWMTAFSLTDEEFAMVEEHRAASREG